MPLEMKLPDHVWPTAPDLAPLRAAFLKAVSAGKDGLPEYKAWLKAHTGDTDAVAATIAAIQRDRDAAQAEFEWLWGEAKALEQLASRVDSNWPGYFYSQAEHDGRVTAWRTRLATYAGTDTTDTEPSPLAVPFVPHPRPHQRIVDTASAPRPYTVELDAALNLAATQL